MDFVCVDAILFNCLNQDWGGRGIMFWVNAGFFCVHLILSFRAKSLRSKDAKEERDGR